MSYNVRLYDYLHSQQIRIYSRTVSCKDDISDIKDNLLTTSDNGGGGDGSDVMVSDNEPVQDPDRSKKVSVNRTKQKIFEIARANSWDWFVTLTFDREKIDSSNYDVLIKVVRKWLNHVKERKCWDMKYLMIPELHKDGIHYHFHGLWADCDGLNFVDSGIVKSGKKVYNIADFKYGFTTATKVEDTKRVSSYISKYITKELENHIKGKRRYLASKNCATANVIDYCMTDEEIKTLIESLSEDITHMKTEDIPVAAQRIRYIELKK